MLADECHIAVITNKDKLHELPRIPSGTALMYPIDFEECVRRGIDAIELLCYGREYSDITDTDLHYSLCGWDCDSIVVLNPNIVVTM